MEDFKNGGSACGGPHTQTTHERLGGPPSRICQIHFFSIPQSGTFKDSVSYMIYYWHGLLSYYYRKT